MKVTLEIKAAIIQAIKDGDCNQRVKPAALLGYENKVFASTMLYILKQNKFKLCKTIKKCGLMEDMRKARLMFYKMYKHWTIKDEKNVI